MNLAKTLIHKEKIKGAFGGGADEFTQMSSSNHKNAVLAASPLRGS